MFADELPSRLANTGQANLSYRNETNFLNSTNRRIDDIFGARSWDDVRASLMRTTTRRWPGVGREDIEDAVGDAMLDLVDYWVNVKSSVTDDYERNFAYAVTRGNWKAKEALGRLVNGPELSMLSLDLLDDGATAPSDWVNELATEPFADTAPTRAQFLAPSAEDTLLAHLEHDAVVEAVNSLGDGEFDRWFSDFWSGDTLAEVANRRGETPDAVRMRRDRGLNRLARNAA